MPLVVVKQSRGGRVTFSDSHSAPVPKFWIRVRQFFRFENPTPVQTPATIIDPTVIHPCLYLRNDHTDSCYCQSGKVTPVRVRFFPNFWLRIRIRIRKKNAESCRSRLR